MSDEERAKLSELRQTIHSQRQYLKEILRGEAKARSLQVEYFRFAEMKYELRKFVDELGRGRCHRAAEAF